MPGHQRRLPRRGALALGTAGLAVPALLLGVVPSVASPGAADPDTARSAHTASGADASAERPRVPHGVDDQAMRSRLTQEKTAKQERRSPADARITEQEPAGVRGKNDTTGGATRAPRPNLGTDGQRDGQRDGEHGGRLRIDGTLAGELPDPVRVQPNEEDDGAIPLARDLGLGEDRPGARVSGRIGDGPHGSEGDGSGDFDFYRFDAEAGETLTVDIAPEGKLFPRVLLYDAEGNLVIGAQDMTQGTGQAHLSHPIERDGTYYVAVAGGFRPLDPFDPASGGGVQTEGPYRLDITVATQDTDVYAVKLRPGEVLGATVREAGGRLAVYGPGGDLAQASGLDGSLMFPESSPLPGGGNATVDHVAEHGGWHFLAVSDGAGAYTVDVVTVSTDSGSKDRATTGARHGKRQKQTIYLDFSGPRFDNRVFGAAAVEPGIRDLTPMRAFLPKWGLDKSDERAVVEATTERVRQILRDDIHGSEVRVLNSLDHPDAWGKPGVSRVIVGGTAQEAGLIPALGISDSIDPGNFERENTAIVMLGRMSGPADMPISLNAYLTEDSDRVRAVAQALGNTIGHEAGHYLGNWHTDDFDGHANLMDTGNLLQVYAFGPDGVAGTDDDTRPAMGTSRFNAVQGFAGVEDSRHRTRVALR